MNANKLLPPDWIQVQGQPHLPYSEKNKLRIDDNEPFKIFDTHAIAFDLTRSQAGSVFIEMINISDYINNIFSIEIQYLKANDLVYSSIKQNVSTLSKYTLNEKTNCAIHS